MLHDLSGASSSSCRGAPGCGHSFLISILRLVWFLLPSSLALILFFVFSPIENFQYFKGFYRCVASVSPLACYFYCRKEEILLRHTCHLLFSSMRFFSFKSTCCDCVVIIIIVVYLHPYFVSSFHYVFSLLSNQPFSSSSSKVCMKVSGVTWSRKLTMTD